MAGNFGSIGLGVDNEVQLQDLVVRLASAAGERLATDAGEYAIWRSRTGAELWFHLGPSQDEDGGEREILGLTPFFEGGSEVVVKIDRAIKRDEDNSHEGAFHGWVRHGDGHGDYPLVFDAVDFAAHCDRMLPAEWRVRLTGFARGLDVLSEQDERAGRQSLSPLEGPQGQPVTTAILTGQIERFSALNNEATGAGFYWVLIDCLGASYDVVVSPEDVRGELRTGASISAECAMFGRVLD